MTPIDDDEPADDDLEPDRVQDFDDLDFDLEEEPDPDERDFWIEPEEEW